LKVRDTSPEGKPACLQYADRVKNVFCILCNRRSSTASPCSRKENFTEDVAKSPKFYTLAGNRGIERQCLNLHRKFINNRFCACAVQVLQTVVGNATKCSTFEVQYGKSMSTRTTAIRHFRATLTERVISRMRTN